jgi:autotransporter-associated beta strand protein
LTKEGDGVLTLAANNSYAGGTVINGGTLSIDTSARINSNNGGLTFNGGTLRTTGTLGFTKSTTLLAGGGTFEVADGTINTWNSAISGDGQLTKTGAGQLSLTAANVYTGTTTVSQGTLLVGSTGSSASSSSVVNGGLLNVNGTAGAVTVNNGGSLGGSGTVGALTLNSGGLLNPGNSPGTLKAASAIVLGGSTYNWQITSLAGTAGTNWDLLSVSGLLDMSGVTSSSKWNLVITADSGFAGWTGTSSYSYVFAQAASVSGFSSVAGTDVTSLFNITTSGIANLPNSSSTPAGEFKVTVESVGGLTTLNLMAVPEPSAASLMGIGLASLIILRRFRRRQS